VPLEELLLEHYEEPYRCRCVARPTHYGEEENKSCGDSVRYGFVIIDGKIYFTEHEAEGCVVSVAASSILMQELDGTRVDQIPDEKWWMDHFKELFTPIKRRCALLPWKALIKALS
jgi:NifU-like protein involved in Fe-S cluster formation